jgi:hypothetical protein
MFALFDKSVFYVVSLQVWLCFFSYLAFFICDFSGFASLAYICLFACFVLLCWHMYIMLN